MCQAQNSGVYRTVDLIKNWDGMTFQKLCEKAYCYEDPYNILLYFCGNILT